MKFRCCVSVFLMLTLFITLTSFRIVQASPPTVSISPATSNVRAGEEFTVDVNLDLAENLWAYEIWLSFDPSVLKATFVNYTGYLGTNPGTDCLVVANVMDNTNGDVSLAVSRLYPFPAITGGSPPPLATIHFRGTGTGTSTLHLYDTILANDQIAGIPHQTVDGTVQVELTLGHAVAITDVVSAKSFVCQGYTASFKVSVQNQGMFTETFNVALEANDTAVDNQTVTLTSGNSTDITLSWNTTGFARGNYTISAYAAPVPGETDTENNNFTSPIMFIIRIPGDVVPPYGIVDMKDVAYLAKRFSTDHSSALWDPNADIDGSGRVDMKDIAVVAKNFGARDP